MSLDTPQMSDFLALARQVKTQAGAQRYGQGIGEQIQKDAPKPKKAATVSPMRLRSLRRQIIAAKEAGDDSLVKQLTTEFQREFKKFAAGRSLTEAAAYLAANPIKPD